MNFYSHLCTTCVALLISACEHGSRLPEYELTAATMGTTFSIKVVAPSDELSMEQLRRQIRAKLDSIELLTSTYIEESELSQFNNNPSVEWITVSAALCVVVEQALELSRQTSGAFDITIGPLVNLWGFGSDGFADQPPSTAAIQEALSRVGYRRLETRCDEPALRKQRGDITVDLSGWAKGYAVDELANMLDETSLAGYLVEVGGELRAKGLNADRELWRIAIERPVVGGREIQRIVRLTDMGMATSGDYRNYFEYEGVRYSHIIDAQTGRPVSHALAAVTVINESVATADAMATALLALGPDRGLAMAEELGIAGYFLIHGPSGIEIRTTPLFDAIQANSDLYIATPAAGET